MNPHDVYMQDRRKGTLVDEMTIDCNEAYDTIEDAQRRVRRHACVFGGDRRFTIDGDLRPEPGALALTE